MPEPITWERVDAIEMFAQGELIVAAFGPGDACGAGPSDVLAIIALLRATETARVAAETIAAQREVACAVEAMRATKAEGQRDRALRLADVLADPAVKWVSIMGPSNEVSIEIGNARRELRTLQAECGGAKPAVPA